MVGFRCLCACLSACFTTCVSMEAGGRREEFEERGGGKPSKEKGEGPDRQRRIVAGLARVIAVAHVSPCGLHLFSFFGTRSE